MKIFVGADHAGFGLKEKLIPILKDLGYEVEDKGAFEYNEADDYPDFVIPVAKEVAQNPKEHLGIVIGGSGQGEAMCANRFRHVHATVYYGPAKLISEDTEPIVQVSREHNDSNVLSLGARFITEEEMEQAVRLWLSTPFSSDERHKRRLEKLDRIHD